MLYLLQINLYGFLMYCVYLFFLKNSTWHGWSRAYLLFVAAFPILLPLVRFDWLLLTADGNSHLSQILLPMVTIADKTRNATSASLNLPDFFKIAYTAISGFLFLRLLMQYRLLRRMIVKHRGIPHGNVLLLYNTGVGPASWGRYILLPNNNKDEAVLLHEQAHIQLKHSYDLVFIQVLQAVCWPYLLLWILARELKTVHEFQADEYAAKTIDGYETSLLNEVFDTTNFSLVHTFFHHSITRRINMLHKKSSPARFVSFAVAGLFIIAAGVIGLQSCHKGNNVQVKDVVQTKVVDNKDTVYDQVAKEPQASFDVASFMASHIKYPAYARSKKIEGRVVLRFTVDAMGAVINPEILRSPDSTLSRAAIDAVMQMPKWTPGEKDGQPVAVHFVLPVTFQL